MCSLLSNIITKKLLRRRSRVSQALSRLRLFTAAQHSKLAEAQLRKELKEKKLSKREEKDSEKENSARQARPKHLGIKGAEFPRFFHFLVRSRSTNN